MAKLITSDLSNLQNEQSAISVINANFAAVENAMENTLSRDGTIPNSMAADLDMDSNRILNLPDALLDHEPATYGQVTDLVTAVGDGAVLDAAYVTVGSNALLQSERALTAGTNISLIDGGAGSTITVGIAGEDLNAYEALASTGLVTRTGSGAVTTRTVTGTANEITLTNGDGVSGNPTVSIPNAVTFTGKTITGGTFTSPTIDTPTLTVNDNALTVQDNSDTSKKVQLQVSGVSAATTRTLTVPDADTTIVGHDATQTLTNKTISGSSNTITNVGGTSIRMGSDAQGDVLYFNGTDYARLPAGTSGHFLKTQGAGANPIWQALPGGGDMLAAVYDPATKAEQVLTISDILDEDNFTSNSATKVPSQQSTKAYVDAGLTIVTTTVANRTALLTVDGTDTPYVYLGESGRQGWFTWNAAVSNLVGADIASSAVDSGTETITSNAHGLKTGDAVVVTSAVNGLSTNTLYYVIRVDANNFRLASSWANAQASSAFNLTGTSATTVKRHNDPRQGIFVTPTADITGASGAWKRDVYKDIDPRWFGALGDGATDDSHAIQGAIDIVQNRIVGHKVYLSRQQISAQYNLNYSLRVIAACVIEGEGKNGVMLYYAGSTATTPILWLDGSIAPNLEHVTITNLTIQSNTSNRADGVYSDNTSYIVMREVYMKDCRIAITLATSGTPRSFGNAFYGVHIYSGSSIGVSVAANFAGGGHHSFYECSFQAPIGFSVVSSALIKGVNFYNCSFEQCSTTGVRVEGTVYGLNFHGGYFEKNGGTSSLEVIPAAAKNVYGLNIIGVSFETDGESYAILLGAAAAGPVEGFTIQGCSAEDYSVALVRYNNANILAGRIVGNKLNNTATTTSNGPATSVFVGNNYNSGGASQNSATYLG